MQFVAPARAATREDPRRAQAQRLIAEGRCPAALDVLGALRRADPNDVQTLLRIGECNTDLHRYEDAIEALRTAQSVDPNDGEVRLQLAIALYHREQFADASVELETAARILGEQRAEIPLYRGLLLLAQPDVKSAAAGAEWLERARTLGGESVEPMASYYAGIGWSTAQDRRRARESLTRVIREWPGTSWAVQAEHRLAELGPEGLRWWGSLRAGMEYDSNAVLQGNGVALPTDISSQRDIRGVWIGQVGAELLRSGPWAAGAAFNYSGSAYRHIKSFDTEFPGFVAWLDRSLDDATVLRLAADTGYAWVAYEPYFWTYRSSLSLIHQWVEAGSSELFTRFWRDDYFQTSEDVPPGPIIGGPPVPGAPCVAPSQPPLDTACGPPSANEKAQRNRDGNGTSIGYLHTARIPIDLPYGGATARLGYQYDRFVARGTEYTYQAHTIAGGLRVGLPWSASLDVAGSWTYRPYRHPSTFPNPPLFTNIEYGLSDSRRLEKEYTFDVVIERPITTWLLASARWHYERNISNVAVFDYNRQIVGAYLTATLGN